MSRKLYKVGIYARLSQDNKHCTDLTSIENQTAILTKFINTMPGWIHEKTYIDRGASGASFDRYGFKTMMEDVRNGIINLVLVKDLSRFGRNYLEAGRLLEEELPLLGCRFVALSDGIDTENSGNDIMPLLNIINDFYVRDASRRIKSVLMAKAKAGHKLGGTAPYGYIRSPADNTKLIIDNYAAGIVRRIFELRANGMVCAKIAGELNKGGVLPPRLYFFKRCGKEPKGKFSETWTMRTIKLILNNEIYIGNTVSMKRGTRSYRDKREVRHDKCKWIRVEGTHAPIVDIETWENAQSVVP